jgi:hypothetical protein
VRNVGYKAVRPARNRVAEVDSPDVDSPDVDSQRVGAPGPSQDDSGAEMPDGTAAGLSHSLPGR